MLPGFLIVLFVEAPHELLEDRAHRVVVETRLPERSVAVVDGGGAYVDRGIEELLDERSERIALRETRDLVAEFEIVEDVLYIRRKAVEVRLEVGPELLLACARFEVAQGELGGVVEGLPGCLAQRKVLARDARLIQGRLHIEHGLLCRLEHGVETAQDGHGQDHFTVFAAYVKIAENIVRYSPDKICEPI